MSSSKIMPFIIMALLATGWVAVAQGEEQAFIWNADDPELEWGPCPEFIPDGCSIAVLQGNPAERNADIFFRLEPGTEVPHHLHTSAERMILVSGKFEVDYDGQDPVMMTAGTYAYGPAGLPHSARCKDEGACVLFIAFEEPVDAIPIEDHAH